MEGIVDGCAWTLYVSSGRRDRFRCCLLFLTVVVSVLALPTKTLASPVAPINADVAMTCGPTTTEIVDFRISLSNASTDLTIEKVANVWCAGTATTGCSPFKASPTAQVGSVLGPGSGPISLRWSDPDPASYVRSTIGPLYHLGYGVRYLPPPSPPAELSHYSAGAFGYKVPPSTSILNCVAYPSQQVIGLDHGFTNVSLGSQQDTAPLQLIQDPCRVSIGVVLDPDVSREELSNWSNDIQLSIWPATEAVELESLVLMDRRFESNPMASETVPVVRNGRLVTRPQMCLSTGTLIDAGLLNDRNELGEWGFVVVANWFRRNHGIGPSATVYYGLRSELMVRSPLSPSPIYLPLTIRSADVLNAASPGSYGVDPASTRFD